MPEPVEGGTWYLNGTRYEVDPELQVPEPPMPELSSTRSFSGLGSGSCGDFGYVTVQFTNVAGEPVLIQLHPEDVPGANNARFLESEIAGLSLGAVSIGVFEENNCGRGASASMGTTVRARFASVALDGRVSQWSDWSPLEIPDPNQAAPKDPSSPEGCTISAGAPTSGGQPLFLLVLAMVLGFCLAGRRRLRKTRS